MKAIIVGAGPTTRDLLAGLSENWDVVLIDSDVELLVQAQAVRTVSAVESHDPEAAVRAELEGADVLLAATGDDAVNLALCEIGGRAGLARVSAVAADPEWLEDYREADVAAVSPDRLTARRFEIMLEPRRVASAAFADGMAEALEFRIAADSPLRGKSLSELASESWLVVSILRDGELIIPHGGSTLQLDDRVTVTGAVADYGPIVSTFTAGVATFPGDYGALVAVRIDRPEADTAPLAEAIYLSRNSTAEGLLLFGPGVGGSAFEQWRLIAQQLDTDLPVRVLDAVDDDMAAAAAAGAGLVVVAAPEGRRWTVMRRLVADVRAAHQAQRPLLLTRGTYPYGRVVMGASDGPASEATIRAAVDVAAGCGAQLVGVAAVPPPFMAQPGADREMLAAMARLRDEAAMQRVSVHGSLQEGNPVRVIEQAAGAGSLLVVGVPARLPTLLAPGAAIHVARRAPASVLVVPPT